MLCFHMNRHSHFQSTYGDFVIFVLEYSGELPTRYLVQIKTLHYWYGFSVRLCLLNFRFVVSETLYLEISNAQEGKKGRSL